MGLIFIVGIRRSGTSVLREFVDMNKSVKGIEFESHDLWAAIDLKHFPRIFRKNRIVQKFINFTIESFRNNGINKNYYGAKFALNPGVKALEWRWLYKEFPEAKFIFIRRSTQATWFSYLKQDAKSFRGMIDVDSYVNLADELNDNFYRYCSHNPNKSMVVNYETLLKDPNRMMEDVFQLLGLKRDVDYSGLIKQPENKS